MQRRLKSEMALFRAAWMQVDTFLDRIDGALDEDSWYDLRTRVLGVAAEALEANRLRRSGYRLLSVRWDRPDQVWASLPSQDTREITLPGSIDAELAMAGLEVNPDGKVPSNDRRAWLPASRDLFEVFDDDADDFRMRHAPHYLFGRLAHRQSAEVGGSDSSSLFSSSRREEAAEDGFAELGSWASMHADRLASLRLDPGRWPDTQGGLASPDETRVQVLSGDLEGRAKLYTMTQQIAENLEALTEAWQELDLDEPDDPLLPLVAGLRQSIQVEQNWTRLALQHFDNGDYGSAAVALGNRRGLSDALWIGREMDAVLQVRLAYPDGPLRQLRALERGLAEHWRARSRWFAFRRERVLQMFWTRFLSPFLASLASLLRAGVALPPTGLISTRTLRPVSASATELPLSMPASLPRVRSGQSVVVGGTRPTLAITLARHTKRGELRLEVLPLRPSQSTEPGVPGVPGLVDAEAPLWDRVTPFDPARVVHGGDPAHPELDGVYQELLTLWCRFALLNGSSTPAPEGYVSSLVLAVHGHIGDPLTSGAPRLLIPEPPPDLPAFGASGELLLLRGEDEQGELWQGVVEIAHSSWSTMEQQEAIPETGTDSPSCCHPGSPCIVLTLSGNTLPVDLVNGIVLHRSFNGFGAATLACGHLLPSGLDPYTSTLQVQGRDVDRDPELQGALQVLRQVLP